MKKVKIFSVMMAVLFMAPFIVCAAPKAAAKVPAKIIAFAERDNALYKKGETIRFKVTSHPIEGLLSNKQIFKKQK